MPTQGTVCNPRNGSRDHNHGPFGGDFFICLVRLDIAYLCTKLDSSSLSHSLDMDGGSKILMGHMT